VKQPVLLAQVWLISNTPSSCAAIAAVLVVMSVSFAVIA